MACSSGALRPLNSVGERFDRLSKVGVFEAFFDVLASMSSSAHLIQMFDFDDGSARTCRLLGQRGARRPGARIARAAASPRKIHAESDASGEYHRF